jgi:hypothetical protein
MGGNLISLQVSCGSPLFHGHSVAGSRSSFSLGSVFNLDSLQKVCLPSALSNSLLGEAVDKIPEGAEYVGSVQFICSAAK